MPASALILGAPKARPHSSFSPAKPATEFSSAVDHLSPQNWDRFAAGFDDFHLFQTAAYADGLRDERRMSHLVLERDGVPVAGARVAILRPPGSPIGIAYIKYGPFWRRSGVPAEPGVYRALLAAIVDEYATRRGHLVSIAPRPHPVSGDAEEQMMREFGFEFRARLKRPTTFFLVDTSLDERALRASLSQSWRHNLKLAERADLDIRFRDATEGLADYRALHDAMVARKQLSGDPLHLLPGIITNLPPSAVQIVTASHGGEVVSGAVVVTVGDAAYYLFGASADAALPLRAGYALHWRIACALKERGIGWYDLGDGFSGIRQFKQGFVGKRGATIDHHGEFDYAPGAAARIVGEAIYGARSLAATLKSSRRRIRRWLSGLAARSERTARP